LLTTAFSYLGEPYGWGGKGGGRDCSRFLLDTFSAFGVQIPRNSAMQARAGTFSVDVSEVKSERDKLALIDAAASRGIALLHFPGHIMLYLGRSHEDTPMVLHSFAEYVEPCAEKGSSASGETLRTVNRVTVSDLTLGRGTSRTAFIE